MASRKTYSMSSMTKAELVAALKELGEVPPQKWSKVELKSRLLELEEEMGIKRAPVSPKATSLQKWVTKLNMANKRRSTLREFITEDLGGNAPDSCTKEQLNKIALDYIYDKAEACGSDPVGFGAHAAKSYQEVMESEDSYCQWVKATAAESNSIRLMRLARWLESPEVTHTETMSSRGYPKAKAPPPSLQSKKEDSASSQETHAMMRELAAAVQSLRSDLDSIKEERPRKKVTDGGDSSGSYSQVLEIMDDEIP